MDYNDDRGKILGTTTCPKTVALGKQFHALCKILLLLEDCFASIGFNGDHKTVYKDVIKSGYPQF